MTTVFAPSWEGRLPITGEIEVRLAYQLPGEIRRGACPLTAPVISYFGEDVNGNWMVKK